MRESKSVNKKKSEQSRGAAEASKEPEEVAKVFPKYFNQSEPKNAGRTPRKRSPPEMFSSYGENKSSTRIQAKRQDTEREKGDPYKDIVFWAKFSSHPYWPAIKCSEEDIAEMGDALEKLKAKYGKTPSVPVIFLGSNNKGVVRESDLLDYSEHFDRLTKKKCGKSFELGIEMADQIVLRIQNEGSDGTCQGCPDPIDIPEGEDFVRDPNSLEPLICDRCFLSVHARCAHSCGEIVNGFDNELPPVWFCKRCVEDAPHTVKARRDLEVKELKKIRKSNSKRRISNAPAAVVNLANKKMESTPCTANLSSGKQHRKKQKLSLSADAHSSLGDDEVTSLAGESHIISADKDLSDNYCFVCGDGGTLIICDFPNCQRSYHKYCLCGKDSISSDHESAPKEEDDGTPWTCPWHFCAVCGDCEGKDLSGPVSSTASGPATPLSCGSGGQEQGKNRRVLLSPPPLQVIPMVSASPPGGIQKTPSASGKKFIRCITCPTALCSRHRAAPRPIYDDTKTFTPDDIYRAEKKGYFRCTHCFGISISTSKSCSPPPEVEFAKALHHAWSRVVNGHDRICQVFLADLNEEELPEDSLELWAELKRDGATNLFQIRNKIWTLQYGSMKEFSNDFSRVANLVGAVYGTSSPTLKQTANTLNLLLEVGLRQWQDPIDKAEKKLQATNLASAILPNSSENYFQRGCLFPSVSARSAGTASEGVSSSLVRSKLNWERTLSQVPLKQNHQTKPNSFALNVSPHEEAKGIAASLLAAVESASSFNNNLPPSKVAIQTMLDEHSAVLRKALRSTAMIRDAFEKTFKEYEENGGQSPNDVITLGEMRVAAEYRLANRNLRSRCDDLKTLLKLEQQARIDAQNKIKTLQMELDRVQNK